MTNKPLKRMPVGSIKLQFAGELILPKSPDAALAGVFRRYQALFEAYANMEREIRILNYKLICGLMLTSYAKKSTDQQKRKQLFELKNQIIFNIANDRNTRRKMAFKYLQSKNFRVIKFCGKCEKENEKNGLERHKWKFCKDCELDRSFYNVLSMHHKFNDGSATLFLSNDLIEQIQGIQLKNKGKLDDFTEEAIFEKYRYNVKNLDAFELDSVIEMYTKLMSM